MYLIAINLNIKIEYYIIFTLLLSFDKSLMIRSIKVLANMYEINLDFIALLEYLMSFFLDLKNFFFNSVWQFIDCESYSFILESLDRRVFSFALKISQSKTR